MSSFYRHQGRSDGTSSAAFEVLIINCEIDFINLFIFNCLTSNINLLIFNCLTSNINLFNFNCLTSHLFTAVYGRAPFLSHFKLIRENLQDTNKFLSYRTLRMSILKCGFPTKSIELTRLVLFEVLEMPQLPGTSI